MLLFEFERALFKLSANTPASAALFQLPPRIGRRSNIRITHSPLLITAYCLVDLSQPPTMRPISSSWRDQTSYFLNGR